MIKIQLPNIDSLLQFHYDSLTKRRGREWTLETHLKSRIKRHSRNPALVQMYDALLSNIFKDSSGFSILTASPTDLADFKLSFESTHGLILSKSIRKELAKAFYYDRYDNWRAYELAKKIGIPVCPYCNRSYTFIVGNDLKKGTRFEYDHFFSRSRYPYLGLSFFNLVPSCHVCNSNFKGTKEFELGKNIHPYLDGFGRDIVFSIKPRNINFLNGKAESYRISFTKGRDSKWDSTKIKAAFKNITTFQLTKLYNLHKDYVDEIIKKSIVYNEDYLNQLFNEFGGSLFKSKEEVKIMILGNYISELDYHKRVLSKLTSDISFELGLI